MNILQKKRRGSQSSTASSEHPTRKRACIRRRSKQLQKGTLRAHQSAAPLKLKEDGSGSHGSNSLPVEADTVELHTARTRLPGE